MPSNIENEVINEAVAYLNENAGEHRRAHWHVDVKRQPGEQEASAFRGSFRSEDEEAIEAELDFVGHHLLGGKLNPIVDATNANNPISTIDFIFERDGSGWKHTGFIHSVADRAVLDAERAILDERLRESLLAAAREGWATVSIDYEWDEPLRFVRMVDGKPEKLSSEGAVGELISDYLRFFTDRGLELRDLRAVVRAEPAGAFELAVSYGVGRPGDE